MIRQFLGLLVCLLLGHRPGHRLYRYHAEGDPQSPITRGPQQFREVGFDCARCGARKETA